MVIIIVTQQYTIMMMMEDLLHFYFGFGVDPVGELHGRRLSGNAHLADRTAKDVKLRLLDHLSLRLGWCDAKRTFSTVGEDGALSSAAREEEGGVSPRSWSFNTGCNDGVVVTWQRSGAWSDVDIGAVGIEGKTMLDESDRCHISCCWHWCCYCCT